MVLGSLVLRSTAFGLKIRRTIGCVCRRKAVKLRATTYRGQWLALFFRAHAVSLNGHPENSFARQHVDARSAKIHAAIDNRNTWQSSFVGYKANDQFSGGTPSGAQNTHCRIGWRAISDFRSMFRVRAFHLRHYRRSRPGSGGASNIAMEAH